jgi:phosphatidylserine/phosphatidylglycerophosphate/cardiolipin synthase-like enzyme
MPHEPFIQASRDGLTATAYIGDGSVLLAFNLDKKPSADFAGFAVKRIPPHGKHFYLLNRLDFTTPITRGTKPEAREYTPSNLAPFQKFRWVDFPSTIESGNYTYEITSMHFAKNDGLEEGVAVALTFEMVPEKFENFEFGFTRGYLSSQAYARRFRNAPIRPKGKKTVDFDTSPFERRYKWLGSHARKMILDFLKEAIQDDSSSVDVFAYDFDEPDILRSLKKLETRLRIFIDNSSSHTGLGALEPEVVETLKESAGAEQVKLGHFRRYAHNKVFIQKKGGKAVRVLTGSANLSVRGLYVQANNVLLFDDPEVASLYEEAFNQAFYDPTATQSQFDDSEIANQVFKITSAGCPKTAIAFSPHRDPLTSLRPIIDAIETADSSVMFAIMELGGGGPVLEGIRALGTKQVFTYGVTQSTRNIRIFKPGSNKGSVVPFGYLKDKVPAPFRREWSGGAGQVVHHKFIIVDFNDSNPVVFTGSSNLSEGGEKDNGDNLLAIFDRGVATAYAIEAVRLLDHYHFRQKMMGATKARPMKLQGLSEKPSWWEDYFDSDHIKYNDRLLFSKSSL